MAFRWLLACCLCLLAWRSFAAPLAASKVQEINRAVATACDQAAQEHTVGYIPMVQQCDVTIVTPEEKVLIADPAAPQPSTSRQPQSGSGMWSLGCGMNGQVLNRAESLEALIARVKKLAAAGDVPRVTAYANAAAALLTDMRPTHRALACEFLAHFPVDAIKLGWTPSIAERLDDPAVAFNGAAVSMAQRAGSEHVEPLSIRVADIARIALQRITGCTFPTVACFNTWWSTNSTYQGRYWYWRVRFYGTPADTRALAELPPLQALKLLLLFDNSAARRQEAVAAWTKAGAQPPVEFSWEESLSRQSPQPAFIATFVKQHKYRELLLSLLSGETAWPEAGDFQLAWEIIEVLPHVLAKADVATLENILQANTGLLARDDELQGKVTRLAVALDPARATAILLAQITRNPRQPQLSVALVRRTGLTHWALVQRVVLQECPQDRSTVIRTVAALRTPEARQALRQLFAQEDLSTRMRGEEYPSQEERDRAEIVRAYVEAVTMLNHGEPVVDAALLDRACPHAGKGLSAEDIEHNRAMPAARDEVMRRLQAFWASPVA